MPSQLHKRLHPSDIKDVISQIGTFAALSGILLYLDEIQYFTKSSSSPCSKRWKTAASPFIASTTENPYFYVYNALLSRCSVFNSRPVTPADVAPAVERAFSILSKENGVKIELPDRSKSKICDACGGDGERRWAFAKCVCCPARRVLTLSSFRGYCRPAHQNSAQRYDRTGDGQL